MTSRPRVRREDTRKMFIEAGRAILREEGLGTGGEALTLKRVSARVESDFGIRFTNASIIGRIWDCQSEYQTDVLAIIAADDSNSEIEESLDRMAPFIGSMDTSSEESRGWSLQSRCDRSDGADLRLPPGRARISGARRAHRSTVRHCGGSTHRGLRPPCPGRYRADERISRPSGRHGEAQDWTLFGLALHALTEQFFELDPEWGPPDLSTTPSLGADVDLSR